ncbi:hypothetical protein A6J80_22855 (plasmid) [Paracoccus yeei]|uniref:Uncharacterized protein n=1 Tax=Paracoccus yeei TaxID=147645 RepID=A0A1V0GZ79_9RHOB|nr:hypothetical protein A6J80_22855 [Paracoccus yeei]
MAGADVFRQFACRRPGKGHDQNVVAAYGAFTDQSGQSGGASGKHAIRNREAFGHWVGFQGIGMA